MDIRSIFLNFVRIAKDCIVRALPASTPFGEHVCGEGSVPSRCGVTEAEDQSVCMDWT